MSKKQTNSHLIKLLLVDDDERIRNSFQRSLSLIGYDVVTAANGEEALSLYQSENPEVVLLDIRMPGMNGFEVLERILGINPQAEVVFITGYGDMNLVIDAMRAGASDFVAKPLQMDILTNVLDHARERLEKKKLEEKATPKIAGDLEKEQQADVPVLQTPIQIQAFGNLFLRSQDKVLFDKDWPNPKTQSVFKILLINHRKTITIDEFIDLLWPETRRESAEVMLFTAISFIRHFFEPELKSGRQSQYVLNRGNGYEMNLGEHGKNYSYDVELFLDYAREGQDESNAELLSKAVDLYSDTFLKTDAYEDWSSYQRELLLDEYLDSLNALASDAFENNRYDMAIQYAQKMLATDKLYEPAYEMLIKTYLEQQLISKAARILKQCEDIFKKELDMPIPERIKSLFPKS
jgi:two-component SAPR family response regulator